MRTIPALAAMISLWILCWHYLDEMDRQSDAILSGTILVLSAPSFLIAPAIIAPQTSPPAVAQSPLPTKQRTP